MATRVLKIAIAYRGIEHSKGWATGDNLVRAFKVLGHEVFPYGNYYGTSTRLDNKSLPRELDLLVYCECNDDDPQYLELRRQKAKARIYWDFDVDNGRSEITGAFIKAMGFDVIFHANKLYANHFKKMSARTAFLPYAFDSEHFYRINKKPTKQVAIIGTAYPQRVEYVKKLKKMGAEVEFINGVFREDFVAAINDLKIHLNLNIYGPGGDGLLVARVWETIGCGTFLLTQRKDFIEDFFKDGKHLALFDSESECAEKIKYYLENEDEREKIAEAGYELGLKNHTYVARAQTMLSEVKDLLAGPARSPKLSGKEKLKRLIRY
jgi:hypothetical protein